MPHPDPSAVLAAVARLVAETPSLTDVVSRLAVLLREGLAFDQLFVLRLDRPESLVAYAATPAGEVQVTAHRIGSGAPPSGPEDANARVAAAVHHPAGRARARRHLAHLAHARRVRARGSGA